MRVDREVAHKNKPKNKPRKMGFKRRDNGRVERPCSKYVEWNGGKTKGYFSYYDKEAKQNVKFDFQDVIILDNTSFNVSGYCKTRKAGIWSNEVQSINQPMRVSYFNRQREVLAEGAYSEIKDRAKSAGGKYTRCLYALKGDEMIHIQINGSALGPWIEQIESRPDSFFETKFVKLAKSELSGNPDGVEFQVPEFEFHGEIPEDPKIQEAYDKVQDYLDKIHGKDRKGLALTDLSEGEGEVSEAASGESVVNTDGWRSYELHGKALGEMPIQTLNNVKANLENLQSYGPEYDMICRGVFELSKGLQPSPEDVFGPSPEDVFASPPDWKDFKTPKGQRIGDFNLKELIQLRESIERSPEFKEKYKDLLAMVKSGISERDEMEEKIPF